jgi:hypothetical protein
VKVSTYSLHPLFPLTTYTPANICLKRNAIELSTSGSAMSRLAGAISLLTMTGLLVVALYRRAFAYIDPGTGSYFIQILIASLLGLAFAIKTFWKNIVAFFSQIFSKRSKQERDER